MKLVAVGTMAFDSLETPFGKAEKIVGGAATYIGISASYFTKSTHLVSVIGDDFPGSFLSTLKKQVHKPGRRRIRRRAKSLFSGQENTITI